MKKIKGKTKTIKKGKFKGKKWTNVPARSLRDLLKDESIGFLAKKELARRGTIMGKRVIDISPHAIDRFSTRYEDAGIKKGDIEKQGGLYSFLYKLALEALKGNPGFEKVEIGRLVLYFEFTKKRKVLLTVNTKL